jgi:hypothetical protein
MVRLRGRAVEYNVARHAGLDMEVQIMNANNGKRCATHAHNNGRRMPVELPAVNAVAAVPVAEQEGFFERMYAKVAGWLVSLRNAVKRASSSLLNVIANTVTRIYEWVRSIAAIFGRVVAAFAGKLVELLISVADAALGRATELDQLMKSLPIPAPRA